MRDSIFCSVTPDGVQPSMPSNKAIELTKKVRIYRKFETAKQIGLTISPNVLAERTE
jgi:hypothetical protein